MTPCPASLLQPMVAGTLCMQLLSEETIPTTACSPAAARHPWATPFGQWDRTHPVAASNVCEAGRVCDVGGGGSVRLDTCI